MKKKVPTFDILRLKKKVPSRDIFATEKVPTLAI